MIKEAIKQLIASKSLAMEQAEQVMEEIMDGEATPAQFGAFVTALRLKGETVDELIGMACIMRARSIKVDAGQPLIDTCGMGGDNAQTFNISTVVALVAAGAGLRVAKHGNRAMSSRCGSADVLEALGVKTDLGAEAVAECIAKVGIGFMLAPVFHPAMRFATAPRREFQVIGVSTPELGAKVAQALHHLGTRRALVVHGCDGLDEISIGAKSVVWEVKESGVLPPYEVSPQEFGFKEAGLSEIRGGTPQHNAQVLRRVLGGERGAKRDVVAMNAAAALVVGGKAEDLREGARLAEEVIERRRPDRSETCFIRLSLARETKLSCGSRLCPWLPSRNASLSGRRRLTWRRRCAVNRSG